ncbi:trigger factor [Mycoplasmopsis sturni]|uniref:trigger factor n=1 Tax=Mycoplasmopsis sturni TaxID=39047 RepID=UPI00056B5BDC|nr:trigger factor [Mycoplasmopsis sturni]
MFTTKLDEEKNLLVVSTKISKEEYKAQFDKLYNAAIKKVKVPGFRPGKAPLKELNARVNLNALITDTLDFFAKKFYLEAQKQAFEFSKDSKRVILDAPTVNTDGFNAEEVNEFEIKYLYELLPDLSSLDFSKVTTKAEISEPNEETIEKAMKQFLAPFAKKEEFTEGSEELTKTGDTVNINFKGFINNEPFEGGEAEEYDLVLGSNSFIPGFEDQLTGKKAGEQVEVKVTFPDTYYVEDFRNKEALFEVKINSFVRNKDVEITEEYVKLLGWPGVENLEQFKTLFKEKETYEAWNKGVEAYVQGVIDELLANNTFTLPKKIVDEKFKQLEKDFTKSLSSLGVKKHEYLKLIHSTQEKLDAELKEQAEKQAKLDILRAELAQRFYPTEVKEEEYKDLEFNLQGVNDEIKKNLVASQKYFVALAKAIGKGDEKVLESAFARLLK